MQTFKIQTGFASHGVGKPIHFCWPIFSLQAESYDSEASAQPDGEKAAQAVSGQSVEKTNAQKKANTRARRLSYVTDAVSEA